MDGICLFGSSCYYFIFLSELKKLRFFSFFSSTYNDVYNSYYTDLTQAQAQENMEAYLKLVVGLRLFSKSYVVDPKHSV